MKQNQKIYNSFFLVSTLIYLSISFEFFIRNDLYFGMIILFNGLLNLASFLKNSRRSSNIAIIVNLFNASLSYLISQDYSILNFIILYYVFLSLFLAYIVLVALQLKARITRENAKRKHHKKHH